MRIFGDDITEEEERIAKKMVLVSLWCIQTDPSDRPSMTKVIKMLRGECRDSPTVMRLQASLTQVSLK